MVYRLVLVGFLTAAVMLPLLWTALTSHDARESARVSPRAGAMQEADVLPAPAGELRPDSDSARGAPAAPPMIVATPEPSPPLAPAVASEAPAAGTKPPMRMDKDAQTEGHQAPDQDVDATVMAAPPLVQPSNAASAADPVVSEKPSPNVEQPRAALAPPEAGAGGGEAVVVPPEPSTGESARSTVSAPPPPADSLAERRIVKPSGGVRNKARSAVKSNREDNTSSGRGRRDGGWIAIMRDAKWLRDR